MNVEFYCLSIFLVTLMDVTFLSIHPFKFLSHNLAKMESAEIQTQPGCEKKNILMLFIPIIFTLGKCATVKNISEPPLKAVFPLK